MSEKWSEYDSLPESDPIGDIVENKFTFPANRHSVSGSVYTKNGKIFIFNKLVDLSKEGNCTIKLPEGFSVDFNKLSNKNEELVYPSFHKPTCDCGAHKTYGPSCSNSFHYDWCSVKDK